MKFYLLAVKMMLKKEPADSSQIEDVHCNYSDVFQVYLQVYQLFHKYLVINEIFDGSWSAPLIEHLTMILAKLAMISDS